MCLSFGRTLEFLLVQRPFPLYESCKTCVWCLPLKEFWMCKFRNLQGISFLGAHAWDARDVNRAWYEEGKRTKLHACSSCGMAVPTYTVHSTTQSTLHIYLCVIHISAFFGTKDEYIFVAPNLHLCNTMVPKSNEGLFRPWISRARYKHVHFSASAIFGRSSIWPSLWQRSLQKGNENVVEQYLLAWVISFTLGENSWTAVNWKRLFWMGNTLLPIFWIAN